GCLGCLLGAALLIRAFSSGKTIETKAVIAPVTTQPIPPEERFDWQPKELVAVLGEHRLRHWGTALVVSFTADGKELCSYGGDNVVRYWDPATGRERRACPGQKSWFLPLMFTADGRTVVTASQDNSLHRWEIATGKELVTFNGHLNRPVGLTLS